VEKNIMNTRVMLVAVLAGTLSLAACEKKSAPTTPPPAPTGSKGSGGSITDAAKNAGDSLKKEGGKAVESVKKGGEEALDAAKKEAVKAANEVTDQVKGQVNGYLDALRGTNSLLEGIKSPLDATAKAPDVAASAGKINSTSGVLSGLSPELQKSIKDQFGTQISDLTKGFKAQVERLTKDSSIGKLVGDSLKSVKLFE
jgi:hypothetical protein